MAEIKQWAYGITVSAIVGAIILSVSPGGSAEKLVRAAVSLFLMCSILSPFLSGAKPAELIDSLRLPEVETQKTDNSAATEYLEENIKEKISDILAGSGIKNADIRISINIDDGNEMQIESVSILADKAYENNFKTAEENLKSQLGIEVKIEVNQ